MEQFVRTYTNGLRLIVNKNDSQLSCVVIKILYGVEHEKKANEGICSLVERYFNNPNQKLSNGTSVSDALELCGGQLFSDTYLEYLDFGSECLSDKAEETIKVLSELLFNFSINERTLALAKEDLLNAQKNCMKEPSAVCFDLLRNIMFSGSGLAKNVFGRATSVENINASDVREFFEKAFHPKNVIVCVSGNVDVDKIYECVFKNVYSKILQFKGKQLLPSKTIAVMPDVYFAKKRAKLNQSRICIGFLTNGERDNKHRLSVVAHILSKKLNDAFDANPHIYVPLARVRSYANNGMFYISFAADDESIEDALDVCAKQMKSIAKGGISNFEFLTNIAEYKVKYIKSMEPAKALTKRTARHYFIKHELYDINAELAEIDSIDLNSCIHELSMLLSQQAFVSCVGKDVQKDLTKVFIQKLKN